MNKLCVLTVLLLFFSLKHVFAQNSGSTASVRNSSFDRIKTYTPTTPEMVPFQRYGDMPVNYNTGVPSISIPLGEVNLRGFSWPISFSYHAGGNKVNEYASNVGLGWTLQAAGSVSSKVLGQSDEFEVSAEYPVYNLSHPNHPDGSYTTDVCTDNSFYNPYDVQRADQIIQGNGPAIPDIYYISTAKESLRMINNITIPVSDNRITWTKTPEGIIGLVMTDVQGNKHTFGRKATTLRSGICSGAPTPPGSSTSVYMLSRIDTYLGDSILFDYQEISYTYQDMPTEVTRALAPNSYARCSDTSLLPTTCNYTVSATELLLTSIRSSNNMVVKFRYESRLDNPGSRRLSQVIFSEQAHGGKPDFEGEMLHERYSYSLDNEHYFGSASSGSHIDNRRLKLAKLEKRAGSDAPQVHAFTYDPVNLPHRLSYEIDKMGYYYPGPSNFELMETRNGMFSSAKASILTGVTYPTGGSTSFSYELNSGGWSGLRVINIVDKDYNGKVVKGRSFNYDTPQDNFVKFWRYDNQYYLGAQPNGNYDNDVPGANKIIECSIITTQSTPVVEYIENFVDNNLSYPTVTETFDDNTPGSTLAGRYGKIIYKYNTHLDLGQRTELLSIPSMLTEKETYRLLASGSYTLARREDTFYKLTPDAGSGTEPLNIREGRLHAKQLELRRPDMSIAYSASGNPGVMCFPKLYHQVDYKFDIPAIYMEKSIVTDFPESGTQIVNTTQYVYDHPAGDLLPTEILHLNSNNRRAREKIVYTNSDLSRASLPQDQVSLIQSLKEANIIVPVWKKVQEEDVTGTPAGDLFLNSVEYLAHSGKVLPKKEVVHPVGGAAKKETVINLYDDRHNAVEIKPYGQPVISYRFNPLNEVTAVCQNAGYHDFAYTDFDAMKVSDTGFSYDEKNVTSGSISFNNLSGQQFSNKALSLGFNVSITKSGLSAKRYIVSGIVKNGNPAVNSVTVQPQAGSFTDGWRYFEKEVVLEAGQTEITITLAAGSSTAFLDEVRLYPADAQMTTYSHDPARKVSFITDTNGKTVFYQYDTFGRLQYVRDQEGNIIKQHEYIYRNQL
jgi:hypothetical protein